MNAGTGTASLAPVPGRERIGLLDALRGLALLGIFVVNIEWFTRPWQEFGSGIAPGASGIDFVAAWVVYVFFAGKFWILFSLLFGMGFAVMMERAQAAGFVSLYLRRLAVLLVIGIAHALLLWVGDILHSYAIAGLLLLALRGLAPRTQLVVGLALYFGMCALVLLGGAALMAFPIEPADFATVVEENAQAAQAAAAAYAGGGYLEVTAQRLSDFLSQVWNNFSVVPLALGVFLVGSWLLRSGRIADVAAHRAFFVRMAVLCLPAGLALTLWATSISVGFDAAAPTGRDVFAFGLQAMGALPMTLGGLALVALAWQSPAGARALGVLAPVGRMALSNYLLQSLVASLVFYGYGLAMWGRIGHAGLLALVLVVFVLQVLASRWWLARFRFGPVEWLWRWLTYGARPPMRKAPSGA